MADLDTQREQLYQRKVEIEAELQRRLDLYLRGTIPTEILDTKAAQKKEMLRAIEEAIAHNEQQRQAPITEDRIAALRAFTEELQRGIAQAEQDFTARRELVELMDVHVQLYWEGDELWLQLTSDLGAGGKRFVSRSLRSPRQPEMWNTVLRYHTKIAHPTRQAGTKEIYDDVLHHAIINRRVI